MHVIGVDDWSWRRGKRFGSILVNLETHKIVGLLADREAESVRQWLAAHPEVDVVSRDRGGVYIDGATDAEPLKQRRSRTGGTSFLTWVMPWKSS